MKHQYRTNFRKQMNHVNAWVCNNMPMGYSWTGEIGINFAGLLVSVFYAVVVFLQNFYYNLDDSGLGEMAPREVYNNFMQTSFRDNVGSGMYLFLIFIFAQLIWIGIHYYFHFVGVSKCIYTMQRIPQKMELHRRCILIPVVTMVIFFLFAGIVLLMDYRIYTNVMSVILKES